VTPSQVFKEKMERVLSLKGWTINQLLEGLTTIGVRTSSTRLRMIASGNEPCSIDEVFSISAVLNVSPLFMLLPPEGETVQITPRHSEGEFYLVQWIRGLEPLRYEMDSITDVTRPLYEREIIAERGYFASLFHVSWDIAYAALESENSEIIRRLEEASQTLSGAIERVKKA
jgi:hypothetical protein